MTIINSIIVNPREPADTEYGFLIELPTFNFQVSTLC